MEIKVTSNSNFQQVSYQNHRRTASGNGEINISMSPQYVPPRPFLGKPLNFMYPINRVIGINRRAMNNKYNCSSKDIGIFIMLFLLLIILTISGAGLFLMWFTDIYNDQYTSKLVLSNNSVAAKWWKNPPITPYLKVHIFNYTNIDRYMKGQDKKLILKDLGPYVYSENSTKVNVVFNNNHTVSYKEHRSYKFVPELSNGKQYDQIVVPNVVLITAISSIKNENLLMKTAFNFGISPLKVEPFRTVAADSFLWGYDDELFNLLKKFNNKKITQNNFGMLINRNGTSPDTYQIFTGEDDLRKLAVISSFNGRPSNDLWSTDECNKVDGTDGSQFPPYLLDKKKHLEVYIQALCRKLPLVFDSEVNVFEGVPAWRYKTPMNVFSHPNENPDNQCFCHIESGTCPPSGVFNGSKCYDAPIFVSFPHFFSGDPILYSEFEGIKPNASIHQTFADIHPRLAFPIDGASRIQINIQYHKYQTISKKYDRLKDGIILPILWIEVTSGELSDDLRSIIYHSSFSVNAIQLALKYGTLLIFLTSLALLAAIYYYYSKSRSKDIQNNTNDSDRNCSVLGKSVTSNIKYSYDATTTTTDM